MTNARVGPLDENGNVTAIADLNIKDAGLMEKVKDGVWREVSIGYRLDLLKDAKGRYVQRNLIVNHCAIVEHGRGGTTKILDAAPAPLVRTLADMAAEFLGRPIGSVKAFDTKEQTMNYEDDLIPIPPPRKQRSARDEALLWLREIKEEVRGRGTDEHKRAWNDLYLTVRDGNNPELALQEVRRRFATDRTTRRQRIAVGGISHKNVR